MMFPPYTYPHSSVLINRYNIHDAAILEQVERKTTLLQLVKMADHVIGRFDIEHLKQIHYQLFSKLYEWAGQFRNVDIGKGQTLFCRATFLDAEARRIFEQLGPWIHEPIPHADMMAHRAGVFLTDLNMLHPFCEGNGRTQRELVRQLARYHGFELDYTRLDYAQYMAASVSDNPHDMAAALRPSIHNAQPNWVLRARYQGARYNEYER